jgi:uncharacterized glyoxalase superfamily protein PhnB
MLSVTHMMVLVTDQDAALDFYVGKLGFEKRADVPFSGARWLTVAAPGSPDLELVLIVPEMGPQSEEIKQRVRELVGLGAIGAGILAVEDCQAEYERLRDAGVEFTEEPTERFYGIDAGLRDPSGNPWRLVQPVPADVAAANAPGA